MLYLNKFLSEIKKNPQILKSNEVILTLGLSSTQIKELKKFALEKEFITQEKSGCFISEKGDAYLSSNPIISWKTKDFQLRPNINLEYLKEEKTPAILTKAIRNLARNLIENQELKPFSLEQALKNDLNKCQDLYSKIEFDILEGKRISLEKVYEKFKSLGITKSLISVMILQVILNNSEKLAIYEKFQFQLKFDQLMFERMIACPENFEIQKTEMNDIYILKDIAKIILNKKSNNILEITKGLYTIIKALDKYVMNTQNLSKNTIRLRNVIINAKDPISLFNRDIPNVYGVKTLEDADRKFLNDFKNSLYELKNCINELINELKKLILSNFDAKTKEELSARFNIIKDYIGEQELKVLYNNIIEINVSDDLWINRIATFINKSRVPKDWSDMDFADFKIKIKELALKIAIVETTIGSYDYPKSKNYNELLEKLKTLSKPEQLMFLREFSTK